MVPGSGVTRAGMAAGVGAPDGGGGGMVPRSVGLPLRGALTVSCSPSPGRGGLGGVVSPAQSGPEDKRREKRPASPAPASDIPTWPGLPYSTAAGSQGKESARRDTRKSCIVTSGVFCCSTQPKGPPQAPGGGAHLPPAEGSEGGGHVLWPLRLRLS